MNAADAAAVARCATGDVDGLEVLYKRYVGSCLSHARSILVDSHHAEGAVQEAYLDLWRCADRFDGHRSSVRGWLLMLTHRKAIDRVRTEQRRKTSVLVAEHDRADDRPGPDVQVLTSLIGQEAREALEALVPVKREALMLAYWGGYTQREIADLTSTPLGTVKTRTASAMRDLRAVLVQSGLSPDAAVSA